MIRTLRSGIGRLHAFVDARPVWQTVALVALVTVAAQVLFLLVLPDHHRVNESADFVLFYEPVARAMAAGEAWVTPDGDPAVRYPPGYSLFLAVVFTVASFLPGDDHFWLITTNILLAAFGTVFHHLLARRLLSPSGAIWASGLWLTYMPFLWLSKQPNSEMPFLVALFAAFWGFWVGLQESSVKWVGGAGLLLGFATLFRPISLLLVVPLAVVITLDRGLSSATRGKLAACMLGIFVLTLLPWESWAYRQTGQWIPVSTGGRLSLLDGLTLAAKPDREGPAVPADVKALMETIQEHRRSIRGPADAARFMTQNASMSTLVKMLWVQASRSWYATESLRFEDKLLLYQVPYLLLALVGLWSLWTGGERERLAMIFIALSVLYFWAMTTLVLSILRYMVPAMALLMVAIAHRVTVLFPPEAKRRSVAPRNGSKGLG